MHSKIHESRKVKTTNNLGWREYFLVSHKDFHMFLHIMYCSISICYWTTAAVFTLGKLMNVKEDYGELSSIARSVHVNYTIVVPPFSCCLFHVPFPRDIAKSLRISTRVNCLVNPSLYLSNFNQAGIWECMPQFIWWICEMVYGKGE